MRLALLSANAKAPVEEPSGYQVGYNLESTGWSLGREMSNYHARVQGQDARPRDVRGDS